MSIFLILIDAPIWKGNHTYYAEFNQSLVEVKCDVCANPAPGGFEWYKTDENGTEVVIPEQVRFSFCDFYIISK